MRVSECDPHINIDGEAVKRFLQVLDDLAQMIILFDQVRV
jgi:hypothetical protein